MTDYPNYEILLVDNNSDEKDALDYIAGLEPQGIRVIRDDSSFNYSALNNLAVQHARGSVIALLNNDVEIISTDWLSRMVALALQPGAGAVGAKLLYPDGTMQHGGVIMGIGGVAAHAHHKFPRDAAGHKGRASVTQNFSAVTGACLVVRRDHYLAAGGLNEAALKVAFNDVDFCLKLLERGLRNIWTPYAELYHHESASRGYEVTPEKIARFEKEKGIFA